MKAFLALIALALLMPFPASAQFGEWPSRAFGEYEYERPSRRYRPEHTRQRHIREVQRRDWDGCLELQRDIGDEQPREGEAKYAASHRWAARVRFHYGEKFTDLNNARDVRYTCIRSSVYERPDSDDDDEGKGRTSLRPLYRCEVAARPCRAPSREDEKRQ